MAATTEHLSVFLGQYERYVRDVLRPTQAEVMEVLSGWADPEHWSKYKRTSRIPIPTPIRATSSRIKRPEQVVDKILRRPDRFQAGMVADSFRGMHDALGVRVVVYFLSHLPLIDRELRSSEHFEISSDDPPVAYMGEAQSRVLSLGHLRQCEKDSGYSCIHYAVRMRHSSVEAADRPWFELQVQTLSQEMWSAVEHHLGYKPGKCAHLAARRQMKIIAEMLGAIDEHFNFLYEELNRYQEEISYTDSDFLDAENLPPVLAEVGISCAQRDINNILKFLYSRGLETVRTIREVAAPKRLDLVRNTYLAVTGRLPSNLEVIATLAAIKGASEAEEVARIKAQIAYRGAWNSIRSDQEKTGA